MDERMYRFIHLLATLLLAANFILLAVSFVESDWSTYIHAGTQDVYKFGLFSTCYVDKKSSKCSSMHITIFRSSVVQVCQVFASFGLILSFLSGSTSFLAFFWYRRMRRNFHIASSSLSLSAGISISISIAVYAKEMSRIKATPETCFYLAATGIPLSTTAGLLHLINVFTTDPKSTEEKEKLFLNIEATFPSRSRNAKDLKSDNETQSDTEKSVLSRTNIPTNQQLQRSETFYRSLISKGISKTDKPKTSGSTTPLETPNMMAATISCTQSCSGTKSFLSQSITTKYGSNVHCTLTPVEETII